MSMYILLSLILRHRWGNDLVTGGLATKCVGNSLAAALDRDRACDNAMQSENKKNVLRALDAGLVWQEVRKKKKKKKIKNGADWSVREKGQEKRSPKILEACEAQDLKDLKSFQNFFTPLAEQTFLGVSTPRYRFSLDPSDESLKSSSVCGSTPLCLEPCGSTPRSAVGRRPVVDIVSGELGRDRSLSRVASPVSHRTLHSKPLTSVPSVGASPSLVACVRASASSLCCACCGVASVGGGRRLCGLCLLLALGGGHTHNSCLGHGHDVLGGTKTQKYAYSV